MGTTNTILASIDTINSEIESHRSAIAQLESARETLGSLVTVDEAKAVRGTGSVKAPGTPIVEQPLTGRVSKRGTEVKATVKKRNGKASRRDQIVALLAEGHTPREIGNELGIAPNYVYHVKRSLNGDAPVVESNDDESPRKSRAQRKAEADAKLDTILKPSTTTRKRAPKATKGTGQSAS